jgi:hypothetical protein
MFDIIAHRLFYSERTVSVCIVTLYSVFVLCFFLHPIRLEGSIFGGSYIFGGLYLFRGLFARLRSGSS